MAQSILSYWRAIVIVFTPLCLLPLLIIYPHRLEARAGFGVLLMAVYWVTEVLPLAVTSLIPVALFPLMGILSTDDVCENYMKAVNMMFVGGLIMAIAIEHCNLHKRIALRVMMFIGTSPNRLMLGFMVPTMFLSMWISNTATTAMMTPIVSAVLDELQAQEDANNRRPSAIAGEAISEQEGGPFDQETRRKSVIIVDARYSESPPPKPNRTSICYYLSIAYAANIGGTGTLTGTATNLTFKGLYDRLFPDLKGLNFASWMLFNVPLMLVNTLVAWLWLLLYMGAFSRSKTKRSPDRDKAVREVITSKYKELGPITVHQVSVTFLFIVLVLLWFFRAPEFIDGWAEHVSSKKIKDATPAILMVILLFIFPTNYEFLRSKPTGTGTFTSTPALVNWKIIHEKMPWGLVLLIGGGMAMADASRESGLSHVVGQELVHLKNYLPPFLIVVVLCVATTFLTEVSSNTAIANIVLPVLAEMATGMRIHPLYFMLPATLCCSYAFMLPVATPPNAIVMAASNMSSKDMLKAGMGMNFLCLVTLLILFPTVGVTLYNCNEFTKEAENINLQYKHQ